MSYIPTSVYHVLKQVQFIKETSEGYTPTTGTATQIAPEALFNLTSDKGAVPIFTLGSRDPYVILEGRHISGFTIRFNPCDTTFMKYAFNLGAGSGTIDDTLTFVSQITIGGTTYYFTANHCRVGTMSLVGAPGSPLLADCNIVCKNPAFSTTAPSITLSSLTGTPLMFYSGGADASQVMFGANAFDATSVAVKVDNNLTPVWTMGSKEYRQIQPGARDFSAAVSGVFRDPSKFWTQYNSFASGDFVWTVNTVGPKSLTISSAELVSLRGIHFNVADLSVMGQYGRGGGVVEEMYMVFGTSIAVL